MKKLKIGITFLTILILGLWGMSEWRKGVSNPGKINAPETLLDRVQLDIDEFKKKPINTFCKEEYIKLSYQIKDLYQQKKLNSSDDIKNTEIYELLQKKLFFAYATLFNRQSFYVFNNQLWSPNDLRFIETEVNALSSGVFSKENPVLTREWNMIKKILSDYETINNLLASFTFSNLDYRSISTVFPYDDATEKIRLASEKQNNPGDYRLKNCSRLMEGLKKVKETIYNAHKSFLEKKLKAHEGKYYEMEDWYTYKNTITFPLRKDLSFFSNDVYQMSNYDEDYTRLDNLRQEEANTAREYYNTRR